ncbi:hypothetical protein VQ02_33090 [Methylobacterium variabile]|jgi:hypothetical protein|uniref:Uncharacterized protein n=2 Tax=Methylobacterium variabile TaxID=298794 RepID=A0A0J6UNG2_9HYPH|nr:hypothetical protein VQ02_33090 [Methylobacterium variabile]
MIGRLISTLRPHKPHEGDETVLAAPPEAIAQFPPMVPLAPPPAVNDEPADALHEAVEEALRAAGYLPEPPSA